MPQARKGQRRPRGAASPNGEAADGVGRVRGPLELIEATCKSILRQRKHRPEDFVKRVEEIRDAALDGLEIVDEQASHFGLPHSPEFEARIGNHLRHKIVRAHTRVETLLECDAEWFGPFQDLLGSMRDHCNGCLETIDGMFSPGAAPAVEGAVGPEEDDDGLAPALPTAARFTGSGRILVVDDDQAGRERMAQLLRGLKHEVETAVDGRVALERLDQQSFDLVVLDLCMEGVDGAGVLQEMRADYALRTVPVIMASAAQDSAAAIRCIELGADDFLMKPVDESLLRARVASCLDKGAIRRNDRKLHEELLAADARNEDLLYQMFPYTVAQELRTGGKVQPRGCDNVGVLFCDLVGFTTYCSGKSAAVVVEHLHQLFAAFEEAADCAGVEKIKTIGDCFLITAGVLGRFANPVKACLECATAMRKVAAESDQNWQVRIGIHVGSLVAGMVGRKQFAFDVWGDTVNTAARIQTAAEPGMIALSEPAWAQVFPFCRGKSIGVKKLKGKSDMEVFRFDGFRCDGLPR
jgi:adenylate cyclase